MDPRTPSEPRDPASEGAEPAGPAAPEPESETEEGLDLEPEGPDPRFQIDVF